MEGSSHLLDTRVFGRDQSVRGLLRVTLAPPLATHLLMPDFAEFARLHPEIEMEILSIGGPGYPTHPGAAQAIRGAPPRERPPPPLSRLSGAEPVARGSVCGA